MRVFFSDQITQPLKNSVVTVGSYDGLHYGHRILLDTVKLRARQLKAQSLVVTFAPHPRQVLPSPDRIALLNSLNEKLFLLREAGIDNVLVINFDTRFAQMPYDRFVSDILVAEAGMNYMVLGYNHHFGSNRKGDFASIEELSQRFGFTAERIERSDLDGQKVSSTVVRKLIAAGDMHNARQLLTRPYIIIADIDMNGSLSIGEKDKLVPPEGLYLVSVTHDHSSFEATLSIRTDGALNLLDYKTLHCLKDAVIDFR